MPRLIWSPAALMEILSLRDQLAARSSEAGTRAMAAIRRRMQRLADQPGLGRPSLDLEPEQREWLIPFGETGFVCLYRFDGETAIVLAIRHQLNAGS